MMLILLNAPPPGETHEPLTMPRSACVAALVLIPVLRIALSGLIPGVGLRGLGARWLRADADVALLVLGMSAACAPWAWQAARSQGFFLLNNCEPTSCADR